MMNLQNTVGEKPILCKFLKIDLTPAIIFGHFRRTRNKLNTVLMLYHKLTSYRSYVKK